MPITHNLTLGIELPKTQVGDWLLLPYPINTTYQSIQEFSIKATGDVRRHDFFYAITQSTWAEWRCEATVQPRQVDVSAAVRALTLSDYQGRFDGEFYCQPDRWVQSHHPIIQQRAHEFRNSTDLVLELIEKLFNHTLDVLNYGNPIQGLYTTQQALDNNCVDCGGYATYLAALCRACQIPTRLVSGFWAGHTHNDMHAWLECLLPDGQWLPLDPSVAWLRVRGRTNKLGGFNYLGSDRIVMNVGSHHEIHHAGQILPLGIIQTPLLINAVGHIDYLTSYQLRTV